MANCIVDVSFQRVQAFLKNYSNLNEVLILLCRCSPVVGQQCKNEKKQRLLIKAHTL